MRTFDSSEHLCELPRRASIQSQRATSASEGTASSQSRTPDSIKHPSSSSERTCDVQQQQAFVRTCYNSERLSGLSERHPAANEKPVSRSAHLAAISNHQSSKRLREYPATASERVSATASELSSERGLCTSRITNETAYLYRRNMTRQSLSPKSFIKISSWPFLEQGFA